MRGIPILFLAAVLTGASAARADEPPKPATPETAPADPAAAEKQKGQDFLAKLDADAGVQKKPSGLRIRVVKEGEGWSPASTDKVKVHYRGTLIDGKEFDSSYKRNAPATFALSQVIACWTEGLQLMKPGGKATLYCPPEIAYGDRGYPGVIPAGATLVFDVELIEVEGAKNQAATPSPESKP